MRRRLLVLEANAYAGEDLLDAAASLGVDAYVATHEDLYAKYPDRLRRKIADVVFTDFADLDVARRDLLAFARDAGVGGVVTAWEFFAPLVTRLAAELGLPGNDPALADASRNKALMADAFAAGDVPRPRTLTLDDATLARARIDDAGFSYPIVVKPAENAGSVGVSVVDSPAGLDAAVRLAGHWTHEFPHGTPLDMTVVVQEYVGGEEYSVETVVARGVMRHLAITQKFTTSDTTRAETGHTVPAPVDVDTAKLIHHTVEQALTSLGIRNGVGHTELKVLDGSAVVIEVGARPPGDNIMKLVTHATGVSEARCYLQAALGDEPDATATEDGATAIRFLRAPRAGTLRRITVPERHPAVVDSVIYAEPGQRLDEPRNNVERLGHVILRAGSPAEVNEVADAVLREIVIEVE